MGGLDNGAIHNRECETRYSPMCVEVECVEVLCGIDVKKPVDGCLT